MLPMTQDRLVQHHSFPGDQKHGPDTAGSKITAALEAEKNRQEEYSGTQGVWKAQRGLESRGAHQAMFLKFGCTETENIPRVSLSLLGNMRQHHLKELTTYKTKT